MPSGRPLDGEFASYAKADIDLVPGDDAVKSPTGLAQETLALLGPLEEQRVAGLTYESGKWTLKEVLGHMADDERIFSCRALCLARADTRPLPGFDEKLYVQGAGFEARTLASLLVEYRAVRAASIALFSGLADDAWLRRGVVNGFEATVRGLAFHIAGHECHHIRIVRERYLSRR